MPARDPSSEPPRVLFGSQDAERSWDPAPGQVFPELPGGHSAAVLASADELLLLAARPGDEVLCSRRPPDALLRRLRDLGCEAAVTPVPGDPGTPVERRIADGALAPGHARGRTAVPYAVVTDTAEAVRALGAAGVTVPPAVAARVNSKTWSNGFCRSRGLAGTAAVARTEAELHAAAAAVDGPLVLKSPYGVAGRGAVVVRDRRQLAVFARRLAAPADGALAAGVPGDKVLLVQPLYRRALDFSAHLDVGPEGTVALAGFRGMTNRGLAFSSSDGLAPHDRRRLEDDEAYGSVLRDLGAELLRAGYHGPVSVDGLLTADGLLVPVLDVNARLSLGRFGLELQERCVARSADRSALVGLHAAPVPVGVPYEEADALVDRVLAAAGLRRDGAGRPGVTALTGGTLQGPVGRLYFAVHSTTAEEGRDLARATRETLASGVPAGIPTAAPPTGTLPAATSAAGRRVAP